MNWKSILNKMYLLASLKTKIKDKSLIYDFISMISWMFFEYCLIHVTVSLSNVPKEFYYYTGATFFIVIVLMIRRVNPFKWYIFAPLIVSYGCIVYHLYLIRHGIGIHYAAMVLAKFSMFVSFAVVIVDELIEKKKPQIEKKRFFFLLLFCVAFGLSIVLGYDYVLPVICPITALYFTGISEKKWKSLMIQFSLSMYVVVYLYSLFSFMIAPDKYVGGRYWGIFNFPVVGALLGALGTYSAFYLWHVYNTRIHHKVLRYAVLALMIVYPIYLLSITMDRAVILGLLSSIAFSITFSFGKKEKVAFRATVVSIVLLIMISISGIIAFWIFRQDESVLLEKTNYINLHLPSSIATIWRFAMRFKYGSDLSYFEQGTIINSLDSFSSYRLSTWYLASKEFRLLGNSPLIYNVGGIDYHAHNTYVEWILRLGYLGGAMMIIWYISQLILHIKKRVEKDQKNLLGFLWATFCLAFMIAERELWIEFPLFMVLVFQYPLIIKMNGECDNDE